MTAEEIRDAIRNNPGSGFAEGLTDDGMPITHEWNRVNGIEYVLVTVGRTTRLFQLETSWELCPEQCGTPIGDWAE